MTSIKSPPKQIGFISENVINALNLSIPKNTPILLGNTNISHMKSQHPNDFNKYFPYISDILDNPDYVGQNPTDDSIEYVKEFTIDNDYVKVAVRISNKGTLFARSIYTLQHNRVMNFIQKGTLKQINKV
ncbi:PBECR3 domain-containing polyvalent protein [Anaerosinus sp.]|uniref:PBECR3 domain-containing polyvalent protein n=1 Tax=Selenobaculum sp. TaxID=3074374 RepID=UPI003AB5A14F